MFFDLFQALNILKNNFGNDAELLLLQDDSTISIRIIVYNNKEKINNQISLYKNVSNPLPINIQFNYAIEEIKQKINS